MISYLAIYHVQLVYGGPEEGGWYYEAGTLDCEFPVMYFEADWKIAEHDDYDDHETRGEWVLSAEAKEAHEFLNMLVEEEFNKGLPSLSSSNSQGRWWVRSGIGHPNSYFPTIRPHYE